MTDWAKWDKFASELSDDEDTASQLQPPQVDLPKPGVGGALSAEGKIQNFGYKPGNARGNALSTNAEVALEHSIEKYTCDEESDSAFFIIRVPLEQCGEVLHDTVRCTFSESSFHLAITAVSEKKYSLQASALPEGGIIPAASTCQVESAGGGTHASGNAVVVRLRKARAGLRWGSLGRVARCKDRPTLTIHDYSWADLKNGVKVWIKVPGVQHLPAERVKVRFRELSFDVTVEDLGGKDYMFAVTELPMEVVVDECKFEVLEDQIKLYLRKWAKTGWFKLTNLEGR